MSHRYRIGLLVLLTVLAVAGVYLFVAPIPQDLLYHNFADRRPMLGIPRVGDVLSNAPFTLAGLLGLGALYRGWFGVAAQDATARMPDFTLIRGATGNCSFVLSAENRIFHDTDLSGI